LTSTFRNLIIKIELVGIFNTAPPAYQLAVLNYKIMPFKDKEKERQYKKEYYQKHKKRINQRSKKWREENLEHFKEYHKKYQKKYQKKYNQEHKEAKRECDKKYYQGHKEEKKKYQKKYAQEHKKEARRWIEENPEKMKAYWKKYRLKHKKERLKYGKNWSREKRKTDPKYRLDENITTAICMALKGEKAKRKWETLVGYTVKDLMKRLEYNFDKNMNWQNYGSYWQVDHKKPRSLFNYKKAEDQAFRDCWCLANLQPLEKIANKKKGNHFQIS